MARLWRDVTASLPVYWILHEGTKLDDLSPGSTKVRKTNEWRWYSEMFPRTGNLSPHLSTAEDAKDAEKSRGCGDMLPQTQTQP